MGPGCHEEDLFLMESTWPPRVPATKCLESPSHLSAGSAISPPRQVSALHQGDRQLISLVAGATRRPAGWGRQGQVATQPLPLLHCHGNRCKFRGVAPLPT